MSGLMTENCVEKISQDSFNFQTDVTAKRHSGYSTFTLRFLLHFLSWPMSRVMTKVKAWRYFSQHQRGEMTN